MSAEGPIVLVTGASGGIGRAVSLAYAGRAARLVLAGRSKGRLDDLVKACEARGGEASTAVTDVTDSAAVRAAVELAVQRYGGLDVVVHTGATAAYGRVTEVPEDVWNRTIDIGIHGTSNVAREALRVFEAAGSGTLMVIGSVLGQVTVPRMGAYVTSKWAVRGLVRVLQQEARSTPGVHVLMVSPGGVATSIYQDAATYIGFPGSPPPPAPPVAKVAASAVTMLPGALARKMMQTIGVDRLHAIYLAIDIVRRGGTISLSGVYGGEADPLPMMTMFDKQIAFRMGQANVHRWAPDILPLLTDDDPLGVDDFATHILPLSEAPAAYEMFQKKADGAIKVVFQP